MQLDVAVIISPSTSCPVLIVNSCVDYNIACPGQCSVSPSVYRGTWEGIEDGGDGEGNQWGGGYGEGGGVGDA